MQQYSRIKRFVRQTLGCSCPEYVFDTIECVNEDDGVRRTRIIVGNRLLIYLVRTGAASGIDSVINAALAQGVRERDKNGLNRFRLVLVTSHRDALSGRAGDVFAGSPCADESTHLHIVHPDDVEGI